MRYVYFVRRQTNCRLHTCGGKTLFVSGVGQGWQCWECGKVKYWETFGADR